MGTISSRDVLVRKYALEGESKEEFPKRVLNAALSVPSVLNAFLDEDVLYVIIYQNCTWEEVEQHLHNEFPNEGDIKVLSRANWVRCSKHRNWHDADYSCAFCGHS
jgi:hypothetical protein